MVKHRKGFHSHYNDLMIKILDKFDEGWGLDYGKLAILGLCIYIAVQVS